mmetsp:Transcript_31393/g.66667  ORF Transcript_31393/g.66667 Transcript_31393/m.66667 type:complete len:1130 (+) Transcript_31393:220-3609(+)
MEAATELFQYNRANFMFDRKLRQEREYQEQDMRIQQFLLYRDDVRDLADLTIAKMDTYLMIALLEIGCCLDLLVEGVIRGTGTEEHHKPPPEWVLWMYVISLAEAMLYLFLSSWFAIHASVACHSYSVRLLTQHVRLPVPNQAQLDAAAAKANEYEGGNAGSFLRIPVIGAFIEKQASEYEAKQEEKRQAEAKAALELHRQQHGATPELNLIEITGRHSPVATLEHIRTYRHLQQQWQAHDAYARACLSIGTYAFLHAAGYYSIGLFVVELQAPWAGLACSLCFPALCWLLLRLDLYFSSIKQVVFSAVLVSGPFLALIGATLNIAESTTGHIIGNSHVALVPLVFLQHIVLIFQVFRAAQADHHGSGGNLRLPTRFRSVLYLDVFNWLDDPESKEAERDIATQVRTGRGPTTQRDRGFTMEENRANSLRHQGLKQSLIELRMINYELEAWQSYLANGKSPDLSVTVSNLKRRMDGAKKALEKLDKDRSAIDEVEGLAPPGELRIWLRLVHHNRANDHRVEYYNMPSTGESRLSAPGEGEWVSDLEVLHELLASIEERTVALRETEQKRPRRGWMSQRRASRELRDAQIGSEGGGGAMSSTGSSNNVGGASGAAVGSGDAPTANMSSALESQPSVVSVLSSGSLPPPQTSNPVLRTQETRFGGREAVVLPQEFADPDYFYPRRDIVRESTRPSGSVPWTIFKWGCITVGFVWAMGLVYMIIRPVVDDLSHHTLPIITMVCEPTSSSSLWRLPALTDAKLVHTEASATSGFFEFLEIPSELSEISELSEFSHYPELDASAPGAEDPDTIFGDSSIVGLSCSEGLRSMVVVAERFSAYALPVDAPELASFEDSVAASANVSAVRVTEKLAACLSSRLDFLNLGLGSIDVSCSSDSGCLAAILSESGRSVLLCSLSDGASDPQVVTLAQSANPLRRITRQEHGKNVRWYGLPSVNRTKDLQHESSAPVKLELRRGRGGLSFVPTSAAKQLHSTGPPLRAASTNERASLRYTAQEDELLSAIRPQAPPEEGSQEFVDLSASRRLLHVWSSPASTPGSSIAAIQSDIHSKNDADINDGELQFEGAWRLPRAAQGWRGACQMSSSGSPSRTVFAIDAFGRLWQLGREAPDESYTI